MFRGVAGRLVAASALAAALGAAWIPAAFGADRWNKVGYTITSWHYRHSQGITFDPMTRTFFLAGNINLYRATESVDAVSGRNNVIPLAVKRTLGYNHLGDITYDTGRHRVLLPLECLYKKRNTCQTGSIAAIDPVSLTWLYYVKLDPAYIKKAMWVEVSPDGRWIYTSSGRNLLAYSAAEVNPANRATTGRKLVPKWSAPVLPAPGVTGATFVRDRLFVALNLKTAFKVVSYGIDTTGLAPGVGDGPRTEITRTKHPVHDEMEGLATAGALNGELHWQIRLPFGLLEEIISYVQRADRASGQ